MFFNQFLRNIMEKKLAKNLKKIRVLIKKKLNLKSNFSMIIMNLKLFLQIIKNLMFKKLIY